MKNKKRFFLLCLTIMLTIALTGCQLALPDKEANDSEDRLVGVLVTAEYLDQSDMMSDLKNNLGSIDNNNKEHQGRLYATPTKKTLTNDETGETTETVKYAFEGVKGISYFSVRVPAAEENDRYQATTGDDAITDGHTSLNVGDGENSISLEGTIYITPNSSLTTYYVNPVYQSADGQVYATSGSGVIYGNSVGVYDDATQSSNVTEGENTTQTLSASYTTTENGKAKSTSTSIKLTVQVMNRPTGIAVLQLDRNSAVLSRTQYVPGKLPKAITPGPGAEYIVVETTKDGGGGKAQVTRVLYGQDAQSLETFHSREDGVCVKQWTQVNWVK